MHDQARVLLAERDVAVRGAIAAALRGDGYEVEEAIHGADLLRRTGLWLAQRNGVAAGLVIVASADLGVFSGTEVLQIVRRFGWDVPCVLINAPRDEAAAAAAQELGAVAVLASPLDLNRLRAVVRDAHDPCR